MFEAKINHRSNQIGVQYVIISDEAGIFDAFNFIADRLADKGTAILSFIYTVSDNNVHPLFETELHILERRYSGKLTVQMMRMDTRNYWSKLEIIEATINSNTSPGINFLVFGNTGFVNYVSEILGILDVKNPMIKLKIA